MPSSTHIKLQFVVFFLVAATFTTTYITQPVLPVLQAEFHTDAIISSFSISAVILGIAISILPFGIIADHVSIRPIIMVGGLVISVASVVCAMTESLWVLIGARFVQGLFIPALTSCLAAHLAKTLPIERLNVVMGSYVSATVMGGLGGRLLGGWIHPPLHWRYAFISSAVFVLAATLIALLNLPKTAPPQASPSQHYGFIELLKRWDLMRIYITAAGSFFVFSSIFNYLPFQLSQAPLNYSTEAITLLYTVYVAGIFMGPVSGRISNRIGSGYTLIGGTLVLGFSILLTLLPSSTYIALGLFGICTGFFTVHAAAVSTLNRKLAKAHGRANALYVLFYYIGGWLGITLCGLVYTRFAWPGVIMVCMAVLILPLVAGIGERMDQKNKQANPTP